MAAMLDAQLDWGLVLTQEAQAKINFFLVTQFFKNTRLKKKYYISIYIAYSRDYSMFSYLFAG